MQALHLTGNDLTFADVSSVVYDRQPVILSSEARHAVEVLMDRPQPVYAVSTGVGKLSDVRIDPHQARELQVNLLRSHAVGVGEPLSEQETRAMMLLRANSLAKGHSGVRAELIDFLCKMLNRGL